MESSKNVPKLRFPGYTEAWKQRKLGGLAEIVRGASPRPIQDPKWFDNKSEVGWLRISDVTAQNGRINHLEQRISEAAQEKTRVLKEPHLLLSIAATVGKPVINYVKTGVHDGFLIFLNIKFEREFLFQWLEMFKPSWQKYGQPGSQVNLNSELVRNQEILIPSMKEQLMISNFFKEFDNTIALHQRKLTHLQNMKASLLQKMFPKNDEEFPEIRFPGFSDDWNCQKLKELVTFSKGNGYTKADLVAEGVPIILYGRLYKDYETVINSVDTFTNQKANSVISKGNEIIVPASGESSEDIARASVVIEPDVILGGDLNIIEVGEDVQPVFLALSISNGIVHRELCRRAQGKSVVHLRNSDLEKVNLVYPDFEEQLEIAEFFERFDRLISLHQQKLSHLQDQKKSLLQQMFI